jgi:hypothetical protein
MPTTATCRPALRAMTRSAPMPDAMRASSDLAGSVAVAQPRPEPRPASPGDLKARLKITCFARYSPSNKTVLIGPHRTRTLSGSSGFFRNDFDSGGRWYGKWPSAQTRCTRPSKPAPTKPEHNWAAAWLPPITTIGLIGKFSAANDCSRDRSPHGAVADALRSEPLSRRA